MVEELTGKRLMVNLHRFMAKSAAFRLEADIPSSPAEIWTDVVTGRPARIHGISSPIVRRLNGVGRWPHLPSFPDPRWPVPNLLSRLDMAESVPLASFDRRVKALWNMAVEAGKTVDVINWWGTWPAERIKGRVVSDRARLVIENGSTRWGADSAVYPADLGETLLTLHRQAESDSFTFPADLGRLASGQVLRHVHRIDGFHFRVAEHFLDTAETDLSLLYLPGMDIIQRWYRRPGGRLHRFDLETMEEYLSVVSAYAAGLDERLGKLLPRLSANGSVVLVLYPGWSDLDWEYDGPVSGLCLVAGESVSPSRNLLPRPPESVAAVVLALLGLPVGQDMDLTAMQIPFSPQYLDRPPVRYSTGYGPRRFAAELMPESEYDRAYKGNLESLLYVSSTR
jgi:hypothetical protein